MVKQPANLEFVVPGQFPLLIDVMKEVISQSKFIIEAPRWERDTREYRKFRIFIQLQENGPKYACGSVEFMSTTGGRTMIRLDPVPDSYNTDTTGIHHLNRLFYLYVQRLVQLGIVPIGEA